MERHITKRIARPATALVAVCLAAVFCFFSTPAAVAGTTGVISGTVTDSVSGAPIADVVVTAASPSGSYRATANARGFYTMIGVYADTYTVSFQHQGYQSLTIPGVSVFADQTRSLSMKLTKSLKTIATVTARSLSSAYQPTQTTDTTLVSAAQIQTFLGSAFNDSETNLITSLPGAESDMNGYPVIHGGREYEEGFEFEGIPYTDAYTNQFINTLAIPTAGVALVELTPGAGDATVGGGGTGTLNVVAKRGTYPAYADAALSIGGGAGFNHQSHAEYSWATADGKWSNYASFAGRNRAFEIAGGRYPTALIGAYFSLSGEVDREFLDNLVHRFGRNDAQSVQLFVDLAQHQFYGGIGGLADLCFASCDPIYDGVWSALTGLSPSQVQAISQLYPGQAHAAQLLAQASNRAPDANYQPNESFKIEYTNNLNPSTFLALKAYRTNSVTTFDDPSTEGSFAGDAYVLQGGQTDGATLSLTKQLNERNLLELGADVSHLHPVDSFRSNALALEGAIFTGTPDGDQAATPYAFVSPSDPNCPLGAGGCGYAYGAFPNATQLQFPQFDQVATIDRQDYSLYAQDKVDVGSRLKAQVGLRWDAATYRVPAPGIDPTYCTTQYLPATWTKNPNYNPSAPFGNGNCPFNATFNVPSNAIKPSVFEPNVGLAYQVGPDSAVRFTYNRGVQFVPITDIDAEVSAGAYINPYGKLAAINLFDPAAGAVATQCGIPGYYVPCRNFGQQLYWLNQNIDGIPYQPVRPTTTDNYQLTLQHQFTKGVLSGVAISVAPWYRNQHDTIASEASPILGPNGLPEVVNGQFVVGPTVATNNGKEFADGVDLNITKINPYGWSGSFTASYINEFSSVIPTSSSEDFFPSIVPASVLAGNMYRVGFISPFQTTLAVSYKTRSGWRFTPRYQWNIGSPTGLGSLTAAIINGKAVNLPNSDGVVGSAPNGPAFFVDPLNPGSVFAPNIAASRGFDEASAPGGKLTPPSGFLDMTIEYSPPSSRLTYGVNINNVFNELYSGPVFNARYQPIANGISGPLTGYSTSGFAYGNYPGSDPLYQSYRNGHGVFINTPDNFARSYYFYVQARL